MGTPLSINPGQSSQHFLVISSVKVNTMYPIMRLVSLSTIVMVKPLKSRQEWRGHVFVINISPTSEGFGGTVILTLYSSGSDFIPSILVFTVNSLDPTFTLVVKMKFLASLVFFQTLST